MFLKILENAGAVFTLSLFVLIGAVDGLARYEQPSVDLRATNGSNRRSMPCGRDFPFDREQDLLGATGALRRYRQERIRDV